MNDADPYEKLAELAETALTLTREGEEGQLTELIDRSVAIAAELPERPPASARPALERAAAAHERLNVWLDAALLATRTDLKRVDRGRRAARSYAAAGPALLDRRA